MRPQLIGPLEATLDPMGSLGHLAPLRPQLIGLLGPHLIGPLEATSDWSPWATFDWSP